MKRVTRLFGVMVIVVAFASVAVLRWIGPAPTPDLTALGTLEATEVTVSSLVTARIVSIPVSEGQTVKAGDVLVRLDDSIPQAQYRQGDAATQQLLRLQLDEYVLHAPRDGVIMRKSAEPGEVAVAGAPLMVIGDLAHPDLTVYVPQRNLGQIRVDQKVTLTVDALPGATFSGQVTRIADQAEFTPRNVQTTNDRLNLVFAVKIVVSNPDSRLKPGMSVVAHFGAS